MVIAMRPSDGVEIEVIRILKFGVDMAVVGMETVQIP